MNVLEKVIGHGEDIDSAEVKAKIKHVVVFILYDQETGRVLSERRRPDTKVYPDKVVFPAGNVKPHERNDYQRALFREMREELGIAPREYAPLDTDEPLTAANGAYTLHPFIITEWYGGISQHVLDDRNPLIWETLEEVEASPIENRAILAKRVKEYLAAQDEPEVLYRKSA